MSDRVIDLDAARRAREEVNGADAPSVLFGGQTFWLPNEMPFDFAALINDGKIADAIRFLLAEQADAFFALNPSVPDMTALAEALSGIYGMSPGESVASSESSERAGEPSRPTSSASTVATSV